MKTATLEEKGSEIPSYLLNRLSERYHQRAARQYKESKELLEAIRLYLDSKYQAALEEEEKSEDVHSMFKALGMRRAIQEFIKILPEPIRGKDD